MTHILFLTPYYPPEKTPPAVRISETAECLVKRGHRVTVLTTFPNFPYGIVPPEYQGQRIQREISNGVHIVRVWSYITPNKGFFRRILGQLSFGCVSPLLGWKHVGNPDVLIVESPPLFDAIGGRLLAWGKHCHFIFTVADLWPDVAIELGMLRNPLLIWLSKWLAWSTYRRADRVWAVTEGIRQTFIKAGLPAERVFLLTNGADTTLFRPLPQAQARVELGWDERFTILFAGTHGLIYGLNTMLDAAEKLRERTDIRIVFAGEGVMKADLVEQAQRRHLHNVTFLAAQPHDRMPLLWSAADVCWVPIRKVPMSQITLSAKMFEVMACARPILLGADGESRQLAEQEAGAALYVEPENADAIVTAVLYLQKHPEVAEILGQRGREFVEARFDRGKLATELETHIERLLGKKSDTRPVGAGVAGTRGEDACVALVGGVRDISGMMTTPIEGDASVPPQPIAAPAPTGSVRST